MKLNKSRQVFRLAFVCAIFLNISTSAQTLVRYVIPSDIGTGTLYSDSVLTSITLPWGVSRVDNNPGIQSAAFELADILRDRDARLLRVYVCGSASPDGLWQENVALSQARTDAAVRYLRHVTGVPVDKIYQKSLDEDWDRLYELVKESDIPYRDEVLYIITTKSWGERKQALKRLAGGTVWRILMDDFFPQLRCVRIGIYCQWNPTKPYLSCPDTVKPADVQEVGETIAPDGPEGPVEREEVESPFRNESPVVKPKVDTIYIRDTVYYMKETVYIPAEKVSSERVCAYREIAEPEKPRVRRERKTYDTPWLLGIKTNLLGDALVVPTFGAEIQLGDKFSLDVQGFNTCFNVFNTSDNTTNVYGFSPEIRYWPGGKTMRSGQFIGLHARCVWYTLVWTDGLLYQNGLDHWDGKYLNAGNLSPAFSAGFTYGYSLGFGKRDNWGLEFLLGIGYVKYSQNVAVFQPPVGPAQSGSWRQIDHQSKNHFGITRAGINLTYRFSVRRVNPSFYENN